MAIEVEGKSFETDEEGYLVNLSEWVPGIATEMAKEDDLELTDENWIFDIELLARLRDLCTTSGIRAAILTLM